MASSNFFDMFRNMLKGQQKLDRVDAFMRQLGRLSFQVRKSEDYAGRELYAISCSRRTTPPGVQWRSLANTIIRFDSENLPVTVAYGIPEVFYAPSNVLASILKDTLEGQYRIYPINFGTVCWLYNLGDGDKDWHIGTKRCVEASNIELRKDAPKFGEVFWSAIAQYPSFDRTKLNPSKTYGFVLYNKAMHLFEYGQPTEKIWHICTRDNKHGDISYTDDIGVDHQDEHANESIQDLCLRSTKALTEVQAAAYMGFILRWCGKTENMTYPHVVIKSPLYAFVERSIGHIAPTRQVVIKTIYSSPEERSIFRSVFPHLIPLIDKMYEVVDELVEHMLIYHGVGNSSFRPQIGVEALDTLYQIVVRILGPKNMGQKTIRDLLVSQKSEISSQMKRLLFARLPTEEKKTE